MHIKKNPVAPVRLTREERRKQTDSGLRDAALREFAQYGVEGTSAERIAEAAGFTRGAFYANYPNKQTLLLDLIREKLSEELESWSELAQSVLDLDDLLKMLTVRSDRFDPDRTWAMVAASINLHAQRSPEFAESYRQYHLRILNGFGTILATLFHRAGKIPPLKVEEIAEAMLVLYRSNRLPTAEVPNQAPQGFSSEMLVLMIRGLIAVAPPISQSV